MLTKSQARLFFILGTVLCAGTFLFLTVDTLLKVPAQTRSANLTPAVERGKELWDKNNCMGCHTILGEGAYYAPELTKVYERRGPEWIRVFIKDPQAMFPGERKMVKYNFTEEQISDIIAYFKWIGEIDLNGFPPKPTLTSAVTVPTGTTSKITPPEKYNQICVACHAIEGRGGNVGPALDGLATRRDAAYLDRWLIDPAAVKPGTAMPKLPLTDAERRDLVNFLSSLK